MEHCIGNAATLRQMLDSCILHFQDNHQQCSDDSSCKVQGYVPNFDIVRSPDAVRILQDFLHNQTVYRYAQDFVWTLPTYYIESYNNSCLIYLDKDYTTRIRCMNSDATYPFWNGMSM